MLLFVSAPAYADAAVQWADPKIDPGAASVLRSIGQLEFVDRRLDWIAYYDSQAIAGPGGRLVWGYSELRPDGNRVAYVAVGGRTRSQIARTLVILATRDRSQPFLQPRSSTGPETTPSLAAFFNAVRSVPPTLLFLLLVFVLVALLAPGLARRVQAQAFQQPSTYTYSYGQPAAAAPAPTYVSVVPNTVPPMAVYQAMPAVLDVDQMAWDLQRVQQAGWLTREYEKRNVVGNVSRQTEVLAAYERYYKEANAVLRSRLDVESTCRDFRKFEAEQILRQQQLAVNFAQLQAQHARALLEKAQAEAAVRALEEPLSIPQLMEREDYGL